MEHWTAIEARKKRDAAIRDKVLGDLKKWRNDREYFMGMWPSPDDFVVAWKDEWRMIEDLCINQEGKDGEL